MKVFEIGEHRLEHVLIKDKKENPKQIYRLIKSDIQTLLENYMEVDKINLIFDTDNNGYKLNIIAYARHLKNIGTLPS